MGISQFTMDRIFRGVRKIEKIELSPTYVPENRLDKDEELFVLVTGSKKGSFYPGTVSFRDPTYPDPAKNKYIDNTYYDPTATVLVEAINDEPLLTGKRYLGKLTSWYLDPDTGVNYPVYTVVYTPPVGYGSGYSATAKGISSATWQGQYDTSSNVCNLIITKATYYLIDDDDLGGMLIVVTPSTSSVALGPFPVHGTLTIPGQTGTVSGTAGSCALSGTVTIPSQSVSLEGKTACP